MRNSRYVTNTGFQVVNQPLSPGSAVLQQSDRFGDLLADPPETALGQFLDNTTSHSIDLVMSLDASIIRSHVSSCRPLSGCVYWD